jgi:hypothetical protein
VRTHLLKEPVAAAEVELVAPEQAHREDLVLPAVAREVEAWEAAAPEARVP